MATAKDSPAITHGIAARRDRRVDGATALGGSPAGVRRRSANHTSWPLDQRSSGFFDRQVRMIASSAGWAIPVRVGGERSWFVLEHCSDHACRRVPSKGAPARDHFVQHAPEAEHVRARVSLGPLQLLRRHVVQRAQERPRAGQRSLRSRAA